MTCRYLLHGEYSQTVETQFQAIGNSSLYPDAGSNSGQASCKLVDLDKRASRNQRKY